MQCSVPVRHGLKKQGSNPYAMLYHIIIYCEEDENSTSHNMVTEIRVRVHHDSNNYYYYSGSNHILFMSVYVCDILIFFSVLLSSKIYYLLLNIILSVLFFLQTNYRGRTITT